MFGYLVFVVYLAWRQRPGFRVHLTLLLLASYVYTCQPLAGWVIQPLEQMYPRYAGQPVHHILVLGCYHSEVDFIPITDKPATCSQKRLLEALAIWQQHPSAIIHLSGDIPALKQRHAEVERDVLVLLGVPLSHIRLYSQATNTEQEARAVSEALQGQSNLVLVTHAAHMHRALRWFQQYGLNPLPAPTGFEQRGQLGSGRWQDFLPSDSAPSTWYIAQWEYMGLLWQQLQLWFKPDSANP